MKILLLLSAIPFDKGEAIEVVSHEVTRLMAAADHEVFVQALIRGGDSRPTNEDEEYARQSFSANGGKIHLLPTICLEDLCPARSRLQKALKHVIGIVRSLPVLRTIVSPYLFPEIAAKPAIESQVNLIQPDAIVSIWSWEALAASYSISTVPKFVYYGNPNHKPPEAQFRYPFLFDINTKGLIGCIKFGILKLLNRAREIQHLRMMKLCEVTANNALIDANYYADMGHPRSIYLQNMWPDAPSATVFHRDGTSRELQICGSVGNLGATGNTFGLYFLGAELMPKIRERLGTRPLAVNVFGGGKAREAVQAVLTDPAIRLRGWVDDINSEISNSELFLVLTNAYGFNVGNTRILLAWSLGACVIAHASSALSMPEMMHGQNILLGETPDEIAELVMQALEDPSLRQKIGRGGYETFFQHYRSELVVPRMLTEIESAVKEFGDRNN